MLPGIAANNPETIVELELWMKKDCFNFNSYSINGNNIYEGYGIEKSGDHFTWYYTERGHKNNLENFQTEKEIVQYALAQIQSDKWAKSHYVGFTTNKNAIEELSGLLKEMGIEYFEDKILYYAPDRFAYRIFVFGCDINKVAHLKAKYYKEKP